MKELKELVPCLQATAAGGLIPEAVLMDWGGVGVKVGCDTALPAGIRSSLSLH